MTDALGVLEQIATISTLAQDLGDPKLGIYRLRDGRHWATEGHIALAAVLEGLSGGPYAEAPERFDRVAARWFNEAEAPNAYVSGERLLAWAGKVPSTETVTCPECDGDGIVECKECGQDTVCLSCDGKAKTIPDIPFRPKSVTTLLDGEEIVVNAALVALGAQLAEPEERIAVYYPSPSAKGPVRFIGRGWALAVMPMCNLDPATIVGTDLVQEEHAACS